MNATAAELQDVTTAILHEIQGVMGLARYGWATRLVRALFGTPAHRLSSRLVRLDEEVARHGLSTAARNLLTGLINGYQVESSQPIPQQGPLLVVSNHPGSYDILILVASLGRDDLKIISSDIAVLPCLPSVASHFIPIDKDPHSRMAAFRTGLKHLKNGKSLLLFARGDVEIDPALSSEAVLSLSRWSPSVELYLRKAPGTRLVISIVSGVLSAHWFNHPVVCLWKKPEQRQKVAEIIQVAEQLVLSRNPPLSPRISFSLPVDYPGVSVPGESPGLFMQLLADTAQAQLASLTSLPDPGA